MDSLEQHISWESNNPQRKNQSTKLDLLQSLEEKRAQQNQETPLEFALRVERESKVDIDHEYCEKHNINFSSREEDEVSIEDSLKFDRNSTKAAFDFITSL